MRLIRPVEGRPLLMGVLNVTPDSFSDGGHYLDGEAAIAAGFRMMEDGADLIDVGGESTRPGSQPVPADEELRRVLPVVKVLAGSGTPVSIDTHKAEVAERCLEAGAQMVNDVTALADPRMATVCAQAQCELALMHMQGTPQTMQTAPRYHDVVAEVRTYLLERAAVAVQKGVVRRRIWLDPGIGFGKTAEHNLALLSRLEVLVGSGFPVLIGVSRKSFIGRLLGVNGEPLPVEDRLAGSLACQVLAQVKGVKAIRAHDVREARHAIALAAEILKA